MEEQQQQPQEEEEQPQEEEEQQQQQQQLQTTRLHPTVAAATIIWAGGEAFIAIPRAIRGEASTTVAANDDDDDDDIIKNNTSRHIELFIDHDCDGRHGPIDRCSWEYRVDFLDNHRGGGDTHYDAAAEQQLQQ
jgi:hypothetical protein